MRELASEVGVSPMTPYRYFKDKDEILAAVRARAFDRFAEKLENAFGKKGTPVDRANAAAQAYVEFALQETASYRLIFDIWQPNENDYPDLVRAGIRARATMIQHIPGLLEAGVLQGDPVLIGHVFWSALHGAVMLRLAGKLSPDCDFQKIIDETMRALSVGFAAGR
ncbi:MAG: TetR/AcrR family transcriptional regulator [Proteobacteria bacterium]|nr:TetR/AcrR family transcriptional regulator [Pseudomonadota bacterium]